MELSAGKTGERLVLVFGNVRIVIQFMTNIEACLRARESEISCLDGSDTHTGEPA